MENDNSKPDYFAGRLIYYDAISPETMRWVVDDGHRKVRFTSRRSAERWCVAESQNTNSDLIARLTAAMLFADKAKQALEAAATFAPETLKQTIEKLALDIRKVNDQIDFITAQTWKQNKP